MRPEPCKDLIQIAFPCPPVLEDRRSGANGKGGAANVGRCSQLQAIVQSVLARCGFGVDASALSVNQLAGIATAKTDEDSYGDTRARIASYPAR